MRSWNRCVLPARMEAMISSSSLLSRTSIIPVKPAIFNQFKEDYGAATLSVTSFVFSLHRPLTLCLIRALSKEEVTVCVLGVGREFRMETGGVCRVLTSLARLPVTKYEDVSDES